jgi:hypothetical protein
MKEICKLLIAAAALTEKIAAFVTWFPFILNQVSIVNVFVPIDILGTKT